MMEIDYFNIEFLKYINLCISFDTYKLYYYNYETFLMYAKQFFFCLNKKKKKPVILDLIIVLQKNIHLFQT